MCAFKIGYEQVLALQKVNSQMSLEEYLDRFPKKLNEEPIVWNLIGSPKKK